MTRCATPILLAVGALALSTSAQACGDKFLVPGRGPQFEQAFASMQPGRILMYRNSSSEVARSVLDNSLRETLQRVGHIVEVVETPEQLERSMKGMDYDIVIADARDVESVRRLMKPEAEESPVMLPVVYKASWTEVNELKQTYQLVVSAPSRVSQILSLVDEAMSLTRAAG